MQAIALLAGNAAVECYGVVGLSAISSNSQDRTILNPANYGDGVKCNMSKHGYEVDIFIYVANNVKITEVSREVQKKVAYVLNKTFGIIVKKVNVFVQGMKEIN